jgi:hypothetical protein
MVMLSLPLWALYEVGILLCRDEPADMEAAVV